MFKIKSLTADNSGALRSTLSESFESCQRLAAVMTVTATTAEFSVDPVEALRLFDAVKADLGRKYGARQHPVASLHSVRRKIVKASA